MNFLASLPEPARKGYEAGWFVGCDDRIYQAATKLVSDDRMGPCWEKLAQRCDPDYRDESGDYGWAESFLVRALDCFDRAIHPNGSWLRMTKREQDQWESDFRSTVDRLEALVELGPLPDHETEIATFMTDLNSFERGALEVTPKLEGEDDEDFWRRIREIHGGSNLDVAALEAMIDRPTFHFAEVLERYSNAQLAAAREDRQQLKKPRDSKAARARFLQDMTVCCQDISGKPMQDVVATTASMLFEDEAITVRLVREHTAHLRGGFS